MVEQIEENKNFSNCIKLLEMQIAEQDMIMEKNLQTLNELKSQIADLSKILINYEVNRRELYESG